MHLSFEPIQISAQHRYQSYFSSCPEVTSDYSFINLWGWAEEYGLSWAWTKDLVWIKQSNPEEIFWAPIGPWKTINWQNCLNSLNPSMHFTRIPQYLSDLWKNTLDTQLQIREARKHWDYIYDIQDLIHLNGNRFHKKKNLVNQFNKKYHWVYLPLDLKLIENALRMQEEWCVWRDCPSSIALSSENRTIKRILSNWEQFSNIMGGAILIDEKLIAYTVAEPLAPDTLLIHFEKANSNFKGSYQAINQIFLQSLDAEYKFVNREQDLDDDRLRQAKLSYHPSKFLKKFHVYFNHLNQ